MVCYQIIKEAVLFVDSYLVNRSFFITHRMLFLIPFDRYTGFREDFRYWRYVPSVWLINRSVKNRSQLKSSALSI